MAKYKKKPVIIEAIKYTGHNEQEITEFMHTGCGIADEDNVISILTLEGVMKANIGDMIIRGVAGEFYPCKPDIFESTYEKVD